MVSGNATETLGGQGVPAQIPELAHDRVTIGPPPEWVTVRDVDESIFEGTSGPFTYLLIDRQYHAGRREHYERIVRRFETLSGAYHGAQWRLDFDPGTQHVVVHSLAVRRPNSAVEQADPKRLRLLQREESLEHLVL